MMPEVPAQPIAPKNPMGNKILQFEEQKIEEMLPLAKDLNLEEMSYEVSSPLSLNALWLDNFLATW